jgi:hypothetical protein
MAYGAAIPAAGRFPSERSAGGKDFGDAMNRSAMMPSVTVVA